MPSTSATSGTPPTSTMAKSTRSSAMVSLKVCATISGGEDVAMLALWMKTAATATLSRAARRRWLDASGNTRAAPPSLGQGRRVGLLEIDDLGNHRHAARSDAGGHS